MHSRSLSSAKGRHDGFGGNSEQAARLRAAFLSHLTVLQKFTVTAFAGLEAANQIMVIASK